MKPKARGLTASKLRAALDYDKTTGAFSWKCCAYNKLHFNGEHAGCQRGKYWIIQIGGHAYLAGRLAWLHVTGEWPTHRIDHKNLNGLDNSWNNLREATFSQNNANRRSPKNKTSGLQKGVYEVTNRKLTKRFGAGIKVNKKTKYLGMYATEAEAHDAYVTASTIYFGEYARPE